jgi:hypothetical protein
MSCSLCIKPAKYNCLLWCARLFDLPVYAQTLYLLLPCSSKISGIGVPRREEGMWNLCRVLLYGLHSFSHALFLMFFFLCSFGVHTSSFWAIIDICEVFVRLVMWSADAIIGLSEVCIEAFAMPHSSALQLNFVSKSSIYSFGPQLNLS